MPRATRHNLAFSVAVLACLLRTTSAAEGDPYTDEELRQVLRQELRQAASEAEADPTRPSMSHEYQEGNSPNEQHQATEEQLQQAWDILEPECRIHTDKRSCCLSQTPCAWIESSLDSTTNHCTTTNRAARLNFDSLCGDMLIDDFERGVPEDHGDHNDGDEATEAWTAEPVHDQQELGRVAAEEREIHLRFEEDQREEQRIEAERLELERANLEGQREQESEEERIEAERLEVERANLEASQQAKAESAADEAAAAAYHDPDSDDIMAELRAKQAQREAEEEQAATVAREKQEAERAAVRAAKDAEEEVRLGEVVVQVEGVKLYAGRSWMPTNNRLQTTDGAAACILVEFARWHNE
jgi:hypothetical protein